MKEFSVVMSLVDFLPVIFFCIGAVILQRKLYDAMNKGQFALFAAGTIDVAVAGFCKALYKLLYALGICDFYPLTNMFFPVQSIGFLLAGLGVLAMVTRKPHRENAALSVAPVAFSGTFVFVALMCLGLGFMNAGLSVQAAREKKKSAIPFFVIAFVCSLCMGYLSSKDFDKAIMNWIAQGVNVIGQGCFMVAAIILNASKAAKAE